jgi:hypothetical protein
VCAAPDVRSKLPERPRRARRFPQPRRRRPSPASVQVQAQDQDHRSPVAPWATGLKRTPARSASVSTGRRLAAMRCQARGRDAGEDVLAPSRLGRAHARSRLVGPARGGRPSSNSRRGGYTALGSCMNLPPPRPVCIQPAVVAVRPAANLLRSGAGCAVRRAWNRCDGAAAGTSLPACTPSPPLRLDGAEEFEPRTQPCVFVRTCTGHERVN